MTIARGDDERASWLERSRAAWDERADEWNQRFRERPRMNDAEQQRAIAALDARPGMRLLDAGCGAGQPAIAFARHGCDVVAVDLSPEMLAHARVNAAEAGVGIEFREGDLGALPDPEASFDRVHCRCVLQYSPDPAGVLRGFARVLKPGGALFVAVPGALSPIYGDSYRRFLEPGNFNNRILPWELDQLLTDLGWRVVDGWGRFDFPGDTDALPAAQAAALPPRLQQAAAAFWATVAERPA